VDARQHPPTVARRFRGVLNLVPAVLGALALQAGSAVLQAGWSRVHNERAAAKRARALAKLRIDWELLMRNRINVLTAAGAGEAPEWCNAALQAVWGDVLAPVIALQAPPLVDLVLHQLMSAPHLLPPWVTGLKLLKMDLGRKAPRLMRVRLPRANKNGTLPSGDLYLDFAVEVALEADLVVQATLETAASKLVSRLSGRPHCATVELHISAIRQGMVVRLRTRPAAQAAFLGLLEFTSKPQAVVTVQASDVGGLRINLPLSQFPGSETITAWAVQKTTRDLMALPHRFIPIDFKPFIDVLVKRNAIGAIPKGGSLRVQLVEAVGLSAADGWISADGTPRQSSPRLGGGLQPYARVEYAFGAKEMRTGCASSDAEGSPIRWSAQEGVCVCDLVGPVDAITITLRRRKVPGSLGRLGSAHLKLYWAADGTTSVWYAQPDGTPVLLKAALRAEGDQARAAAGVQFSGRDGHADVWLPLQDAAGGEAAALRVLLTCEWFGTQQALSAAETRAAVVMQRFVRRWKARRRLQQERALMCHGHFTPILQLCVTLQSARGLPFKSGFLATVALVPTAAQDSSAAATIAHLAPAFTPTCAHACSSPTFGTSVVLDVPPGGLEALYAAQPALMVKVYRKDVLVASALAPLPQARLQTRGEAVRWVHELKATPHVEVLAARAAHRGAAEVVLPAVVLYACLVLKSAPPGSIDAGLRAPVASPMAGKLSLPKEADSAPAAPEPQAAEARRQAASALAACEAAEREHAAAAAAEQSAKHAARAAADAQAAERRARNAALAQALRRAATAREAEEEEAAQAAAQAAAERLEAQRRADSAAQEAAARQAGAEAKSAADKLAREAKAAAQAARKAAEAEQRQAVAAARASKEIVRKALEGVKRQAEAQARAHAEAQRRADADAKRKAEQQRKALEASARAARAPIVEPRSDAEPAKTEQPCESPLAAADAALTRALDAAPRNAAAWANRGSARLQAGRWEEAAADLARSLELEEQTIAEIKAAASSASLKEPPAAGPAQTRLRTTREWGA